MPLSTTVPLAETLLVVVGRGSSDPDANSNVAKVTRLLVEGLGFGWGETVYSGVTFPLVEPGLRHAVKLGFRRVVVVPYFLFSGVLVSRIRQHTELVAADHPEVEFLSAGYLGDHTLVGGHLQRTGRGGAAGGHRHELLAVQVPAPRCWASNRTWDAPKKATTTMWKALRKAARFANWSARVPVNPTASRLAMTIATLQTTPWFTPQPWFRSQP